MSADTTPPEPDRDWIAIAVLGRARGNRGELTAVPLSKPERYENLGEVFLFPDGSPHEVESAWFHNSRLILKFRGVDTISDAERLEGCEVRVPRSARQPLEPGEYYESDLIGCEVVERDSGACLGLVTGWQETGGSGLLEVAGGLLIPFARSICVAIQPEARRIVVDLPAGLKELNQA
ncbi:MAG: ribosome maturation factor RimM [Bryobacteraceae bacterium]